MIPPKLPKPLHIMLAIDGSENAWAALAALHDLPVCELAPAGSSIAVLAVMIPRDASEYGNRERLLEEARRRLLDMRVPVTTELLVGYPAEMLTGYAESHRPDLVVMGATGLRATLGIFLGGVAQAMVEYSCCPILIVRGPYQGFQRILLAVDGSPSSRQAVQYLSGFPLPSGSEVQVVHVLPPLPAHGIQKTSGDPVYPGGIQPPAPEISETADALVEGDAIQGSEILEQAVATLKEGGKKASNLLLRGDAATEIIQQIKGSHIDLVVAGSRGLNPVRGWLLGSVSRKLLHYSGCSVLVVKGMNE